MPDLPVESEFESDIAVHVRTMYLKADSDYGSLLATYML